MALGFDYDKEIHAQDAVAHGGAEVERAVDTFNAFMRGFAMHEALADGSTALVGSVA